MIKIWLSKHSLVRRILWSCLIVFIFLLGKGLPSPFLNLKEVIYFELTTNTQKILVLSSGDQVSLFGLSIGPWMSATIIMSVLGQLKAFGLNRQSQSRLGRIQLFLTLIIALLQAVVTVNQLPKLLIYNNLSQFYEVIMLIAGAFLVMWLCNMNAKYGLGGSTLLVMINILQSGVDGLKSSNLLQTLSIWQQVELGCTFISVLMVFTWLNVFFDRSEVRLPLIRLLSDDNNLKLSYVPIKLIPAGGMPLMFAFAFMSIPIYLIKFLIIFFPNIKELRILLKNCQLNTVSGVIIYCVIIFGLSLMFAFINTNPHQQMRNFKFNGDYLRGVTPGTQTERYLRKQIWKSGLFGAIFLTVIAGFPVFWGVGNSSNTQITMLPGIVMMEIGFGMMMLDQIKSIMLKSQYKSIV